MRRRIVLLGSVALAGYVGLAGYRTRTGESRPAIPDAPAGDERWEQRWSAARGRAVGFYTAVPAGHGTGRGLPVCLVLHGASATTADFATLGLGRFLTDAVRRGAPPFVLAGADGGRLAWRPAGGDDPQRLIHEEVPAWCRRRGFDTRRVAAWGWSMGGYGALLLAEAFPRTLRAVAAFSPAVGRDDDVTRSVRLLRGTPVGLWCGTDDPLRDSVRALRKALPEPARAGGFGHGRHNFGYWSRCVPDAFDFLGGALRP